jgi:tetratricopeptide (TPR) repeat protein
VPTCRECGAELAEDDRFCRRCGARVSGREPSATVEAMAAEYRKAVADHPNDPDARYSLGLALLYSERWAEAEEHLRKVVELTPGFADGWCRLTVCVARLGRLEDAWQAARRGLEAVPGCEDLRRLAAQVEDLIARHGPEAGPGG